MANIDKTDVEQYIASLFEDRKMKKLLSIKLFQLLNLSIKIGAVQHENPFRHVQLFKFQEILIIF